MLCRQHPVSGRLSATLPPICARAAPCTLPAAGSRTRFATFGPAFNFHPTLTRHLCGTKIHPGQDYTCILYGSKTLIHDTEPFLCWMEMPNVTVAVPEELKKKMEHVPDVNWSEVARQAFEETIRRKQMREAAKSTDRLRESSKTPGWSGAAEIRKWRDRDQRSKS